VIRYVTEKYGADKVAMILFGGQLSYSPLSGRISRWRADPRGRVRSRTSFR
jgi:hypothetical protein